MSASNRFVGVPPAPWRRGFSLWGPPAVYALAIFASSSLSAAPSPPLHLTDKHVHVLAYAGLALVLVRALSGGRWAGVTPATALQAALMTIAYGATDEWHQSFVPGRDADVRDLVADAVGAALAVAVVGAMARWGRRGRAGRRYNRAGRRKDRPGAMTFETLLVEQHGTVVLVTLNRPEALNALNAKLLSEMSALIAGVAADAGLRVLVLTGAGDRAFGAGADIAELVSLDAEGARHFAASGQAVFGALERLGKPSIAAINGFALGGGCELAMACTLRLAADTAQFGQPEIDLGIIPGFGGSQRLARLVGRGRALALLLGGHRIGAVEAERIGLINRVVPAADLKAEALALAQELAGKAPLAMRYLLNAVYAGADLPLEHALQLEATLFGLSASTADMKEGTRAFLEKRKPEFRGR